MAGPAIPRDCFVVTRPDQRRALASPLRLEIIEHLAFAAPAGIADIARRMGRPPASLYYHFRLLEKSGLIVPAGSRKSGKRDETLYRLVASRIALPSNLKSPASTRATIQTVGAMFRLAGRELKAALQQADISTTGRGRAFYVRRLPAHLDAPSLADVNRHIDAIELIVSRAIGRKARGGEAAHPCAITIALLPLAGRKRTA